MNALLEKWNVLEKWNKMSIRLGIDITRVMPSLTSWSGLVKWVVGQTNCVGLIHCLLGLGFFPIGSDSIWGKLLILGL